MRMQRRLSFQEQAQGPHTTMAREMTPQEIAARLTGHEGHPDSTTVAAVLAALRADPDWTVTEVTVDGRPVLVELAYEPTGAVYTLRTQQRRQADAPDP